VAVPSGLTQDLAVSASQVVKPAVLDRLAVRRVIFMGEVHNRPEHHAGQLAAIRALHEYGVDLAVGLESFQRPYQSRLDDYVSGRIDEEELLRLTGFEERWGFDFGLYREILELARDQGIPLVALNAPSELVQTVSRDGIDALPPEHRRIVPTPPELAQGAYRERLISAFGGHATPLGNASAERLQRFLEVQMLWDETMAQTAADYLTANPGKTLVILAGTAHVGYADAIPRRLWRRYPVPQAWVFPDLANGHSNGAGARASHPLPSGHPPIRS
jgi:uncharacterized iron-regulated protein